jgi:hypothetical protein
MSLLTFLEHLGPVDFDQAAVGILVLLPVAHGGQNDRDCAGKSGTKSGSRCVSLWW